MMPKVKIDQSQLYFAYLYKLYKDSEIFKNFNSEESGMYIPECFEHSELSAPIFVRSKVNVKISTIDYLKAFIA